MNNLVLKNSAGKAIFIYLLKFLGAFILLYGGSQLVIGLAAPGNMYSPFIHDYLNYPAWLRTSLLAGSKIFLSIFGFDSVIYETFYLRMPGGRGIHMVYSCLGIGVLSFWIAFIFANKGTVGKKLRWILVGCSLIWLINVARICLLFILTNQNKTLPGPLDHHTLFNIAVYIVIFFLIWRYDAASKQATF